MPHPGSEEIPGAFRAEHGPQHEVGPALPEPEEMHQAEGEQVAGVVGKDVFPEGGGTVGLALRPGREGCYVRPLPLGRMFGQARGFGRLVSRLGEVSGVEAAHGEHPGEHVAQRERRICRQHG